MVFKLLSNSGYSKGKTDGSASATFSGTCVIGKPASKVNSGWTLDFDCYFSKVKTIRTARTWDGESGGYILSSERSGGKEYARYTDNNNHTTTINGNVWIRIINSGGNDSMNLDWTVTPM